MQRRKGAGWERELAAHLRSEGIEAQRGIGQARRSSEVPDVDVDGWWIEAKRHQRTNPKAALQQAIGQCAGNEFADVAAAMDGVINRGDGRIIEGVGAFRVGVVHGRNKAAVAAGLEGK
mgnify:CR=1 FL=1